MEGRLRALHLRLRYAREHCFLAPHSLALSLPLPFLPVVEGNCICALWTANRAVLVIYHALVFRAGLSLKNWREGIIGFSLDGSTAFSLHFDQKRLNVGFIYKCSYDNSIFISLSSTSSSSFFHPLTATKQKFRLRGKLAYRTLKWELMIVERVRT